MRTDHASEWSRKPSEQLDLDVFLWQMPHFLTVVVQTGLRGTPPINPLPSLFLLKRRRFDA